MKNISLFLNKISQQELKKIINLVGCEAGI